MISRLAKAQKGWIAKLILSLTALSFISFFGITEYINRAGANRTVIKVDNIEISKAQFAHQAQKDINEARRMMGDDAEITEDIQSMLIHEQIQKTVRNAVLDRTAQKYNIEFRPALLSSLIVNQPAFQDETGRFNPYVFQRYLSQTGMTEGEMLAGLRRDLVRRLVVELPVLQFNVPQTLIDAMGKVDNKRRTFKYVEISPDSIKVDRQISQEEIEQYYEDFSANFMEPERRDITMMFLSLDDIADQIQFTDEEIKTFYKEHVSDYETPQKRQILQMMFDNEQNAKEAYAALQAGADFYDAAAQFAGQSVEDTDLGYVAEDELIMELAQEAFAIHKNQFTAPINDSEVWRILKVADIQDATKVPYEQAVADIKEQLRDEELYSKIYEISSRIDDKLAAGETLDAVAGEMNKSLAGVKGVAEDGSLVYVAPQYKDMLKNQDLLDAIFSYALNETSQVIETDEGLIVFKIDNIVAEHPKAMSEVQEEIRQLWLQNEKIAIEQELLADVMHDLENGDDLLATAKRYGLEAYRSQPITRNETFAQISYPEIREMFTEQLGTPHQIQVGDKYVIAVADQDYRNSAPLTEAEQQMIKFNATMSLMRDMTSAMMSSYAKDYDIRIKYKLMGLED